MKSITGSGVASSTSLVEVIELPETVHPWFLGTQAHPEYKSRPNRPSPLYREWIGAALERSRAGSGEGALVRR